MYKTKKPKCARSGRDFFMVVNNPMKPEFEMNIF